MSDNALIPRAILEKIMAVPVSSDSPEAPRKQVFNSLTSGQTRLTTRTTAGDLALDQIDEVNDFTRARMREDGFYRRTMPPIPITNDELDRQYDTDQPVKIVDSVAALAEGVR